MRAFLLLIILFAGLLAVDAFVFDEQYRRAAWLEAKYQGQEFRYKVDHWLKNLFPK